MRALLLIIHGTRDPEGLAEIRAFIRRVRRRLKGVRAEFALLAPGPRALPTVVERLRRLGVREVDVVPFLLFSGSHVRRDIPRMIADIRRRNPGMKIAYGRHIGPSDAAARIALARWREIRGR